MQDKGFIHSSFFFDDVFAGGVSFIDISSVTPSASLITTSTFQGQFRRNAMVGPHTGSFLNKLAITSSTAQQKVARIRGILTKLDGYNFSTCSSTLGYASTSFLISFSS
jgi:hypothetical protein